MVKNSWNFVFLFFNRCYTVGLLASFCRPVTKMCKYRVASIGEEKNKIPRILDLGLSHLEVVRNATCAECCPVLGLFSTSVFLYTLLSFHSNYLNLALSSSSAPGSR